VYESLSSCTPEIYNTYIYFWRWGEGKNRAEGKDCGGREIYERMVIQRQAAAPYLSHYAEQIRWLRSVAAVLIKMGTNSKGERIRQPQQRQQKKEGVKVFHPKRIRKRTYISFYYKLRL
jgi:hypothetical protein